MSNDDQYNNVHFGKLFASDISIKLQSYHFINLVYPIFNS